MVQKTLELGPAATIHVEQVGGELHLKGWQGQQALLKTTGESEVTFEYHDTTLRVICPADCILYAPHDAHCIIQEVGTQARLQALEGQIEIEKIGSDLSLRDVGAARVEKVGADFSARRVRGDLRLGAVGGQARVRDVDGQFSAESIGGNLRLSDVSGGVSAVAGGSIRLEVSPVPWQAYTLTAGGNLRCQVPGDLNATCSFSSGAQKIRVNLPTQNETIRAGQHQLAIGAGGAQMQFKAGGKIDLIGLDADWEHDAAFEQQFEDNFTDIAETITRQTSEQIKAQLGSLDEQLSGLSQTLEEAGVSAERSHEIHQRLDQARQRATQRAQAAAERAQAKLERKLAQAQRKTAREKRKSFSIDLDALQTKARTAREPISDEERLVILKMLQNKTISVDQAEELLTALEGK